MSRAYSWFVAMEYPLDIMFFFCVRPAVLLTTMSPSDFYTKDRKSGVIDVIKASEQCCSPK